MSTAYVRQLLSGRDFAHDDPLALAMRNFAYLVGDRDAGEVLLVDPAYHPVELATLAEDDGLRVVGVLATHYHADHVGGRLGSAGHVQGLVELLAWRDLPVHVHRDEAEWVVRATGVDPDQLVTHDGGDQLRVGDVEISLIHTPGHTPGSQCVLVDGHLLSGDTLFLDGCGRTDLPGGSAPEMYQTLTHRLSALPATTRVLPGHLYSAESSLTWREVRERNPVLGEESRERWLAMYGS